MDFLFFESGLRLLVVLLLTRLHINFLQEKTQFYFRPMNMDVYHEVEALIPPILNIPPGIMYIYTPFSVGPSIFNIKFFIFSSRQCF